MKIQTTIRRKLTAAAMAGCLAAALFAVPAWAHGHGRSHHRRIEQTQPAVQETYQYPVCCLEGCEETGWHIHDGSTYCGYRHSSGYCDGSCGDYGTNCSSNSHHGCHY
ncbi:MAG: hypothetical protein HFG49_00730 [Lachnospiraceae bacterium]|nr:hypothetical protein [Lachnospiraceae bacterium]